MHLSGTLKPAFCAAFALILVVSASAQMREEAPVRGLGQSLSADVGKPGDAVVVGSPEELVRGRVLDFGGRSVRSARVTLFCLETDDVHRVSTNAFGYYQVKDLVDGHSYVVVIEHPKYLFLTPSVSITLDKDPVVLDFQAERIH